jgi:hypothetical protein
MRKLNLPEYEFRFRQEGEVPYVLDIFRKRFVMLTPEEEVRQRFSRYLMEEKGFPASLIMTEYTLKLNEMTRRCDILIHKPAGNPAVLIECKAPEVKIGQDTFDQVARYNLVFNVKYLMISNGLKHFCCYLDFDTKQAEFMKEIPSFSDL